MRLILDASVAASWHLKRVDPDEISIADRAVVAAQRYGVRVPAIWFPEVANAILIAERRGVTTPASNAKFLADLATIHIQSEPTVLTETLGNTLDLARTHQLTAYDATYLELALRLKLPFATFDQKLAQAARSAGIPIFGDPS